jgi:hypothetical protein
VTGRRLPNDSPVEAYLPGDYGVFAGGFWAKPPQGASRPIPSPFVHGDGTISAVTEQWALVHGEWRSR